MHTLVTINLLYFRTVTLVTMSYCQSAHYYSHAKKYLIYLHIITLSETLGYSFDSTTWYWLPDILPCIFCNYAYISEKVSCSNLNFASIRLLIHPNI